MFFLPEGNLDNDAGDGAGGGDHLGPQKNTQKQFVRKWFTLLDIFHKTFKNIFKISSYIQKMKTNPINAFKITITKNTPQIQKTHFQTTQHLPFF